MLRILNRQNLHSELYCTEFSVQKKFLPVSSYYNNPYDMFTSFDHLFSNRLKCAILKLSSEQE